MAEIPAINKVILFGDSVLFGTGASNRNYGCARVLRGMLPGISVIIKGKNKDSTREGLKRLNEDVLGDRESSYVILLFGNNDCRLVEIDTPLVSLVEYRQNLKKIIQLIKSDNKIPILSNLQAIDSNVFYKTLTHVANYMRDINSPTEWQKQYSLACEEVAKSESIKLVDIRGALDRHGNAVLVSDGLHPNDLGHKIIARAFFEALKGEFLA